MDKTCFTKVERTTNCFKCVDCEKTFKCNSQLVIHKRVHTRDKPYKCKECDNVFPVNSICLFTKEFIREKNHTNVILATKVLLKKAV